MNVISKRGLLQLIEKHPGCGEAAAAWFSVARKAHWNSLADVRRNIPSADLIGRVLVFNLRRNDYRLICTCAWDVQRLYVKALLNHKEYDRKEWMKWA